MTVHQVLEALQDLIPEVMLDVIQADPQDNDWIQVTFDDGTQFALTVEELQ